VIEGTVFEHHFDDMVDLSEIVRHAIPLFGLVIFQQEMRAARERRPEDVANRFARLHDNPFVIETAKRQMLG
jgi:hypothetical protein